MNDPYGSKYFFMNSVLFALKYLGNSILNKDSFPSDLIAKKTWEKLKLSLNLE